MYYNFFCCYISTSMTSQRKKRLFSWMLGTDRAGGPGGWKVVFVVVCVCVFFFVVVAAVFSSTEGNEVNKSWNVFTFGPVEICMKMRWYKLICLQGGPLPVTIGLRHLFKWGYNLIYITIIGVPTWYDCEMLPPSQSPKGLWQILIGDSQKKTTTFTTEHASWVYPSQDMFIFCIISRRSRSFSMGFPFWSTWQFPQFFRFFRHPGGPDLEDISSTLNHHSP